jgi:hypothetical protein
MAQVAVLCMWVWHCPRCDTRLKAHVERTVLISAEYHIHRTHQAMPAGWDTRIDREHWAFHVYPDKPVVAVPTLL